MIFLKQNQLKQLKKAAYLSYFYLFLSNIGGIFLTPYIIDKIGDSQYGIYTLIGGFLGYLAILDLGLNSTIIRYVSLYRVNGEKQNEQNFLAISGIIYIIISMLIAGLGLLIYHNIDALFQSTLTNKELGQAKIMMLIIVVNVAITIPGRTFEGICIAYEHFLFPKIISTLKYILRFTVIIVVLRWKAMALTIVIVDAVLSVLVILLSAYYVLNHLKVKYVLHNFNFNYVKSIFSYSLWIFVFSLSYIFQWSVGQTILGTKFEPSVIAIYGVGVMLGIYFRTFGNVLNNFILPKAIKSVSTGLSNSELSNQFVKIARILLILLLFIFGAFLTIGDEFIYLWVGKTYENSWVIAVLIMIVNFLPVSQGYANAILEAKKKVKFKGLGSLTSSVLGLILGTLLSNYYGIFGMISGIVFFVFIYQITMAYYYHYKIKLNMLIYLKKGLLPLLPPFFITYFIVREINIFFDINNWLNLAFLFVVYFGVFCISFVFVLNKYEKSLIKNFYKF